MAEMSTATITGTQPIIEALTAANTDLAAKRNTALEARATSRHASADAEAAANVQRGAVGNLAGLVQQKAAGDASFILNCGFEVSADPTPLPPITEAPTELNTKINGTPGRVIFSWSKVLSARNYEIQYTTDLTGATGWVDAAAMTGKTKLAVDDLNSGTKYAFHVRACGNGAPGPRSVVIIQMAP